MLKIIFAILTVASIFISPDCSGKKAVTVSEAWVQMLPPSTIAVHNAAVYVTLHNEGKEEDALVSATTKLTDSASLYHAVIIDGASEMQPTAKIAVPVGHDVKMHPHRSYILLSGLQEPLTEGGTIALTLNFQSGDKVEKTAIVESADATKFEN